MFQHITFCLAAVFCLSATAQTINVRGTVSNATGKPIANATVTLTVQKLTTTTTSTGAYSLTKTGVIVFPVLAPQTPQIFLKSGILEIGLATPSPVLVEIFDVKGNRLTKEFKQEVSAGVYRLNIAKNSLATNVLVIRATIGNQKITFHYMPLNSGKYTVHHYTTPVSASLSKTTAAAVDTIKAAANGYLAKSLPISKLDTTVNITLDSAGGKNPPCPSAGCGKDLSDIKSGTYTMTSAGLSRKYIVEIPANYDKNTPYRMIFGMHMMGGDMNTVVSMKYYELKTYAGNAKVPIIFISPEGNSDGSPWRINDNKDHVFFGDMLKLLKEKLCVDTSRVFCCGFSYGAMVSYSLSLDFTDQLRAVATYAPANWNIWLPTNPRKPIAYWQSTGTADNLCSYVYNDSKKQGGKYCVIQHLEDNGCTVPSTIPLATGSTHVSTEFSGCQPGYPVIFGSHNGGHTNSAKDPGSNVNWIAKETWDFFMRF
jgi:poly(3-hydroxybutyrate) depolymerase